MIYLIDDGEVRDGEWWLVECGDLDAGQLRAAVIHTDGSDVVCSVGAVMPGFSDDVVPLGVWVSWRAGRAASGESYHDALQRWRFAADLVLADLRAACDVAGTGITSACVIATERALRTP